MFGRGIMKRGKYGKKNNWQTKRWGGGRFREKKERKFGIKRREEKNPGSKEK